MIKLHPFIIISLFSLSACGIATGSSSPNDPTPSGTIVAQGTFTSLNGQTVTGNVAIYNQSGGAYVLRLVGISAPSENALMIVSNAANMSLPQFQLRSTSGTQNYSFSLTSTPDFSSGNVTIHSSIHNEDYGQALLLP